MSISKILIAFIFQFGIVLSSTAGAGAGKFTIGAEAGGGLSALYSPTFFKSPQLAIPGTTNKSYFKLASPAVSAGVNFQYNFSRIFGLHAAFDYNRLQFTEGEYIANSPNRRHIYNTLNYLTLPVTVRASFGRTVQFFVEAGGYASVLVKPTGVNLSPGDFVYFVNPVHRYEAGLVAGAGVRIPLPQRFALTIEQRNTIGLSRIISALHNYSCVLLAGATYTFGGKK